MNRYTADAEESPQDTPLPTDSCQVSNAVDSDVEPVSACMSAIALGPRWGGEALHCIVRGAQEDRAEDIDNHVQSRIPDVDALAVSHEQCPDAIVKLGGCGRPNHNQHIREQDERC